MIINLKEEFNLDTLEKYPDHSIAVCTHDKGSAAHISSWLMRHDKKLNISAHGPSKNSFSKFAKSCFINNIEECVKKSKLLISGTGWETDLEHLSRKIAKNTKIPSIAVIDHWTNYLERFNFNEEIIMPDHILVSDEYAKIICKKIFPNIVTTQLSNIWLESIIESCRKIQSKKNIQPTRLVYFTEPYREKWKNQNEPPEFQAINYFFKNLKKLSELKLIDDISLIKSINIKTHPSEMQTKYKELVVVYTFSNAMYKRSKAGNRGLSFRLCCAFYHR